MCILDSGKKEKPRSYWLTLELTLMVPKSESMPYWPKNPEWGFIKMQIPGHQAGLWLDW